MTLLKKEKQTKKKTFILTGGHLTKPNNVAAISRLDDDGANLALQS